jgi:hypothetical protein
MKIFMSTPFVLALAFSGLAQAQNPAGGGSIGTSTLAVSYYGTSTGSIVSTVVLVHSYNLNTWGYCVRILDADGKDMAAPVVLARARPTADSQQFWTTAVFSGVSSDQVVNVIVEEGTSSSYLSIKPAVAQ